MLSPCRRPFTKKVKVNSPEKLKNDSALSVGPGHTVRLELTPEPLTVHTDLSLSYAMAEALQNNGSIHSCHAMVGRVSGV